MWESFANGINYLTYATQTGSFTPSTTGVYFLGFHCYSAANQYNLFLDDVSLTTTLDIDDYDVEKSIYIQPIPVYDYFNISSNLYEVKSVSLIDLNGRTVKTFGTSSTSYSISELVSGVYFVNIETENGVAIKKIIKN